MYTIHGRYIHTEWADEIKNLIIDLYKLAYCSSACIEVLLFSSEWCFKTPTVLYKLRWKEKHNQITEKKNKEPIAIVLNCIQNGREDRTWTCVTTNDMILKYLGKQNPKAIMTRYTEMLDFINQWSLPFYDIYKLHIS